jgi:hypothetical protein
MRTLRSMTGPWIAAFAAVGVLIGAVAFWFVRPRETPAVPESAPAASGSSRLVTEAERLRAKHPNELRDLVPLTPEELRRAEPDSRREMEGVRILAPKGKGLSTDRLIVETTRRATSYAVEVLDANGAISRSCAGEIRPGKVSAFGVPGSDSRWFKTWESPLEDLPSGKYTVQVTVKTASSDATDRASVEIPPAAEIEALDAATDSIWSHFVDPHVLRCPDSRKGIANVLIAHLAWRRGFRGLAIVYAAREGDWDDDDPLRVRSLTTFVE